jgi:hypothetical protein
MQTLSIRYRLFSWAYLLVIVLICIFLYKDYGISWDEPVQRGIGEAAYNYVTTGNRAYMQMHDKIYGVGFELPLIYLERLFHLTDSRDIFLFRHLANVLFFAFACFIFFRLNFKLFQHGWVAIIPTLMLVLTPRIFAHAFFNSKDLPFLCMYIISYYTLYNYLVKPRLMNLLLLAIAAGLLINFRIMGVLFLMSTVFVLAVSIVQQKKIKPAIHMGLFGLVAALSLYATWPYLWENPFNNFKNAFILMSKFPWHGTMLLNGEVISPGQHLVKYLIIWVGITIPILYLCAGLLGMVVFGVKNLRKPTTMFGSPMQLMGWVFMVNTLAPVVAVLVLKSVLYDDWRQLYFIYPGLVLFAGYLLYFLYQAKPRLARLSSGVFIIYMGFIGIQMYQLHPYEHVYFNEVVPKKKNYLQEHYDLDYWGTSFYEGLSYIAKTDPSDTIPIFLFHDALRRNWMLLPEKDRKRIVFLQTDGEKPSKYYLTTFRFDYIDIIGNSHYKNIVYTVERQNSTVLRIWTH